MIPGHHCFHFHQYNLLSSVDADGIIICEDNPVASKFANSYKAIITAMKIYYHLHYYMQEVMVTPLCMVASTNFSVCKSGNTH